MGSRSALLSFSHGINAFETNTSRRISDYGMYLRNSIMLNDHSTLHKIDDRARGGDRTAPGTSINTISQGDAAPALSS